MAKHKSEVRGALESRIHADQTGVSVTISTPEGEVTLSADTLSEARALIDEIVNLLDLVPTEE